MKVSVGLIAYNEESNIGRSMDSILSQTQTIDQLIVVSSACTDKTDAIVKKYSQRNRKIQLICQTQRLGKVSAINEFLKAAKGDILILESADTIPKHDSIEKLSNHFNDPKVGIVGAHPIPIKPDRGFLGFLVRFQWEIHHQLSMQKPKFGEMIAFRNIIKKLSQTSVDEEGIAQLIQEKGYLCLYEPKAILFNNGPKTIMDFLKQRRRIYCGHIELRKKTGYTAASMDHGLIANAIWKTLKISEIHYVLGAAILEVSGRLLGQIDYFTQKEKHYIWEIAKTA